MLGMNSRHWSNEDPKPKCSTDKPIIYNMRYCPYAQRAILVALHKNIE
jgi:glutathionyl-hydroquinone reductase